MTETPAKKTRKSLVKKDAGEKATPKKARTAKAVKKEAVDELEEDVTKPIREDSMVTGLESPAAEEEEI